MQTLTIISYLSSKLEGYTKALRDFTLHFGEHSSLAAALTIGAFVVGCLIISYFANR